MSERKKVNLWIILAASVVVLGAGFAAVRMTAGSSASASDEMTVTVLKRKKKKDQLPYEEPGRRYQIPVSSTQPSQGPADALVTLVHWCDFRSKQCRRADKAIKELMQEYPGQLRWVFRHLPAKKEEIPAHWFAHSAFRAMNKFWEARDLVLQLPNDKPYDDRDFQRIVGQLGMLPDMVGPNLKRVGVYVDADMRFAEQFGVRKPMGTFVNGRRVPAGPSREIKAQIKPLVEEELVTAAKLVASGTPKTEVYQELTKGGYWGIKDDPKTRPEREKLKKELLEKQAAAAQAAMANQQPGSGAEGQSKLQEQLARQLKEAAAKQKAAPAQRAASPGNE